jgi:DNA mismatch repair protein MutS
MNNQHIIFEYDKYLQKYKKIYGEKTILLMQIGSFFEMCSILEEDNKLGEQDIFNICDDVLNVVVGKKWYKSGEEQKVYYMGGFPLIAQEKYLTYLLNHNFTVVLVEQITEPPNPERKVTKILSPGTDIEFNKKQNNFLVSIFIEHFTHNNKDIYEAGLSAIDLSTGKNYLHNIINESDPHYYIDEISRLINFYNPSELIFQTENYNLSKDDVICKWDINHDCYRINHFIDNIYKKPSYQNNTLNELFNIDCMLNPLNYFNLEDKTALRLSYIYMISYIKEHKVSILNNIEKPLEHLEKNYLTLTSNSIRQLNVVNNYSYFKGKNESLLAICNICETAMGKRDFKDRLLYPLLDKNEINKRYEKIELFRNNSYYENVREYLKNIQDLEKTLRLISLDMIEPYILLSMYLSYEYVNKLVNCINDNNIKKYYNKYNEDIKTFYNFRDYLKNTFNFSKIYNASITKIENSIFIEDKYPDIDIYDKELKIIKSKMNIISDKLSNILDSSNNSIKIANINKEKDNEEWVLYCTKKRAESFKKIIKKLKKDIVIKGSYLETDEIKTICKIKIDDISFKSKDGSNTYICLPIMIQLSKDKNKNFKNLQKLNKKYYEENIKYIYNNYSYTLKQINKYISDIDICSAGAKLSIDNNYYRPEILDGDKSLLDIKDMRHPIVERINTETEYITNNIKLGYEKDGILLFGTNACGKSTFMKAIGLNLILAQAGLYVACSQFKYVPYTQIFTRILNNDNIFRSESTFAVEMNELRSIMERADSKSLVLGDELCSGTETTSALSIVYAGLYTLSNKKSSYVFTSHLHQITELNLLDDIKNLQIYHLQIKYINDILIYDRKLKEGPGPSIYGITVCEALGLSKEFVHLAKSIQLKIEKKDLNKVSHYNKNIIMDKCKICNNRAEETHHINEQCKADKNGNINHFHKNIDHNLVPLCKKCHLDTTHGDLIIEKYINTTEGKKLVYYYKNKNKKGKRKYNDEMLKKILKYKNEYNINKTNCIKLLELNDNIKISKETLKKIMENKY